ncbi:hypothetical protein BKA83DRAFT_13923 [Pisolithus microcarpus]|nr:hypothetical protein BKA83DRAFT_13923 [Pisolithus microcarpus]
MPPHQSYQQSKESSTKQPCKHCRNLYLPQGIKKHENSCLKEVFNRQEQDKHNRAYVQDVHQTKTAKEAATVMSLSLHPVAESLGSPLAAMPVLPRWPSVGPSQSIPGSPTHFTLDEDDILAGMMSPRGRDMQAWVPELVKEERKTSYVNFKCVIWHEAFLKLLEKVAELSKVGYLHECYDGVLHWLFLLILILSADYEELCVMTLIRGTKCKRPCLICLVPLEKLWDLLKTYETCTIKQHKEVLAAYDIKKSVGEKKLKSLGLCPIKNIFWLVEHSEPEQATSFEPLHYMHGGMGGKHMHEELKIIVGGLGHEFEMWLEEHYLKLDMLIGLDVHTEKTISMIEDELLVFRDELKVYQSYIRHLDDMDLKENWNFPKAHLWKHITHDIRSKGVVCNYSAWPNKKMHSPLKDAYQDHSNGRDVAGQILCVDHHQLAIKLIQACIDSENKHAGHISNNNDGDNEDDGGTFEGNTKLGAPQPPISLSDIEAIHRDDRAFEGFIRKLETFLNTCLPMYGYPLDEWIRLQGTHTVQEYQYLKVNSGSSNTSSDLDCSDSDGDISEPEELREWHRIMCEPAPDASAPQLCNALGIAQLAYSKLHNHKRAVENNPNTVLDNNIVIQAKKYCFFYHFWIPKDLFPLTTLPPGYDLDDPARWSMSESKLVGFKAELYLMLPNDLKVHATTYSNFGHVFSNAVGAKRPNILKPVKDNMQQLFAYLGLGNVDTRYTPLSPILFPKPDAPFKTQLLVNIIQVMVFGKSVLAGKQRGGPQGWGQKLGISGTSAGLIAIAVTFAWYLLLTDHELTAIGEESGFKYQDDFEYFIKLLSDLSK